MKPEDCESIATALAIVIRPILLRINELETASNEKVVVRDGSGKIVKITQGAVTSAQGLRGEIARLEALMVERQAALMARIDALEARSVTPPTEVFHGFDALLRQTELDS